MIDSMRARPRVSVRFDATTNDRLLGTTSLIRDDVYDAAGTFLGEIEELLIDARTGCVRYAVLAVGGFLGVGRKRFAVSWRAFSPDANYRRCIVDRVLMQLTAQSIPRDDPSLRHTGLISNKENAYVQRRQALMGVIPSARRVPIRERARPKWNGQPD